MLLDIARLCLFFATARVIICAVQMADKALWCRFPKRFQVLFTFFFNNHQIPFISCLDFCPFIVLGTTLFCGASKSQEKTKNRYLFPIIKIILTTIHVNRVGKKGN
jgi:hypothetical protein